MGVRTLSSIEAVGKTQQVAQKKNQTTLLYHIRINSKWVRDLDVRPETLKTLEENIVYKPFDIGLGNFFLICLLGQKQQKKKMNKWE